MAEICTANFQIFIKRPYNIDFMSTRYVATDKTHFLHTTPPRLKTKKFNLQNVFLCVYIYIYLKTSNTSYRDGIFILLSTSRWCFKKKNTHEKEIFVLDKNKNFFST